MYEMLTTWISSRGLEGATRSVIAKVGLTPDTATDVLNAGKKPLKYSPYHGGFYFWYKRQLLFYQVRQETTHYYAEEEISVTCLGRSPNILKTLLQECRNEYLEKIGNKITIFGHRGSQWKRERVKEPRPLSTVILREREKAPLVKEMKDFLNARTRRWYTQRSIPYRRGYLLYGPPGTGKSSFSLSVAGELGLDIYTVSISSVDDEALKALFEGLPENCVVLLEDIDAAESAHSRESAVENSAPEQGLPMSKRMGVSLSGLLNILDGIASQEDRILIMTTNHIDTLDPALIRPGRVDQKVGFHLVDREIATQIFYYIFGQREASAQGRNESGGSRAERQAMEFARRIPEGKYSPAQVISYLLRHRDAPDAALENIDSWIQSTIQ